MNRMYQLIKWCDIKISFLKKNGIEFKNDLPVLPQESLYSGIPQMVETYAHRNDIPSAITGSSLIAYFDNDVNLMNRIYKIDNEIEVLKQFGGICGFDLSPCVTMLRPRQKFSLLVSAVFNCYVALHGIKVLTNARVGDLSTISSLDNIPAKSNIITGEIGCHKYGYKAYGLYQLKLIRNKIKPNIIFVYGFLSNNDIRIICENDKQLIIFYPSRRQRMRDKKVAVAIQYECGSFHKRLLSDYINNGGM